jgi:hypothetical protein
MNTIITAEELETHARQIMDDLVAAQRGIRERMITTLVGRQVEHIHHEDDPTAEGGLRVFTVTADVVGVRWTYDDEMLLEVAYAHPTTGERVDANHYMP